MSVVRAGIVGAGWIAREHRRVLADAAGVELAAVCDTDPGRAADLASGTGARTYADWRDMLDREELGALVARELLGEEQGLLEPFRFGRYEAGELHPVSHSPFPWS